MVAIKLDQHRALDTVRALEALLALAKRGKITGLIFACKCHTRKHEMGVTGDYTRDPLAAIGISSELLSRVRQLYHDQLING